MFLRVVSFIKYKLRLFYVRIQHSRDSHKMIMENHWANVFNNTISNSDFLEFKAFTPGRWAANYTFLYILYRALNEFSPKNIIEFGLGETSKITIQYAKKTGCNLCIIDHDSNWVDFFIKKVPCSFDVKKFVKVYQGESFIDYRYGGKKRNRYKGFNVSSFDTKFDFFIIDGLSSKCYSRNEILDFIEYEKIADSFVIIFDDCQTIEQMETIEVMKQLFHKKGIDYVYGCYDAEKTQYLFTNPANSFLTTL